MLTNQPANNGIWVYQPPAPPAAGQGLQPGDPGTYDASGNYVPLVMGTGPHAAAGAGAATGVGAATAGGTAATSAAGLGLGASIGGTAATTAGGVALSGAGAAGAGTAAGVSAVRKDDDAVQDQTASRKARWTETRKRDLSRRIAEEVNAKERARLLKILDGLKKSQRCPVRNLH